MKKVTIINQDSGYLMIDIANSYCEKGYDTTLVAGRIVERDICLDEKIKVKKIAKYNRNTNIKRLQTWLLGALQIWSYVFFRSRKSHLLIVSNPPLAPLLTLLLPNRYSLLIFDIFPDALTEYGFASNKSFIVKLWKNANKKVYCKAHKVYTLTNGMRRVLEQYQSKEKIDIVPLWTNNSFLKPIKKEENKFASKYKLKDKFVVLYSGNFGYSHRVDLLVDLATKIKNPKIMFVIIGGGTIEDKLREKIAKENITNCLILPWQDVDILPYSLSSADLSVVTLSENASGLAIPSKAFNYLSVGSPILGITSNHSDLEELIKKYDVGKSFNSGQVEEIIKFIETLSSDSELLSYYKEKSIEASNNHTIKNVELITQNNVV